MKKGNKLNIIVILFISAILLLPFGTNARQMKAYFIGHSSLPGYHRIDVSNNYESIDAVDPEFQGEMCGNTYSIYCVDPGKVMHGEWNAGSLTCSDTKLDDRRRTAIMEVYNAYSSSHWKLQEALRRLVREWNGQQSGTDSNLLPEDTTIQGIQNAVHAIWINAGYETKKWEIDTKADSSTKSKIEMSQVSHQGQKYVISVKTNLNFNDIKFTCGSDCQSVTPNAESKTVTVVLKEGKCTFKLNAKYGEGSTNSKDCSGERHSASRPVLCTGGGSGLQNMIVITDLVLDGNTPTTASFTPTDISDECEGEPEPEPENKCTQHTEVHVDTFCDADGDKYVSITAPTDVKNCIIEKEDEAGNTYKMNDGQLTDNKYCAVYCKEDYMIDLPGAKYTTSGRYFEVENVPVHAERTCYTTNRDGTAGIDIKQFVTDILAKQTELINKKNDYEIAKKELELSKSATATPTSCYSQEYENAPLVEHKGTIYSISASSTNTGSRITSTDNKTGEVYIATGQTLQTSSRKWGTDFTRQPNKDGGYDCVEAPSDWDFEGEVARTKGEFERVKGELEEMISQIEDCYSWINDMCMSDDQIEFWYREQYNTSINYKIVSGPDYSPKDVATYKKGETIDDEYTANESASLKDYKYLDCPDDGNCTKTKEAHQISTLLEEYYYRKIKVTGDAEYANIQEFATNYPHGTIDTVAGVGSLRQNYSYLGAIFPVALNTSKGVYQWKLNISNLGQYNDDPACKTGRLDEVVQWWEEQNGQSVSPDIEYVCVYVVDCDDCDYDCVGDHCYIPDEPEPKCPDCDIYCVNCIFDGENTYFYRTVSVNEFNPNNRTLGYNWTNEKGTQARDEIETNAETIYENAEYTYVLDANSMKKIRDYNKETGTYVAQDLNYHSAGGFNNAYGTSSFLDEGAKKGFFKEVKRNKNWEQWSSVGENIGPAWK